MAVPERAGKQILELARAYVRRALRVDDAIPPFDEAALHQPAGCFVSLHTLRGRLRGCVGRIDATRPLSEAIEAASGQVLHDPRFADAPVRAEELAWLEIEVSVLSPPRPAPHPLAFEPLSEGIYLTIGRHSGCFLPQVARETGWTREQLLDRLCTEKMDLAATAWREPGAQLHVFSVDVIGPEPFETSIHGQIGKHQTDR